MTLLTQSRDRAVVKNLALIIAHLLFLTDVTVLIKLDLHLVFV
jgi:hypothetical protein